jgi:hypothetical protein
MGLFKAYKDTMKEVREIDKTWDPKAQREAGKVRMAAGMDRMAEMTRQANLQATGVTCSATVTAIRETGQMINMQPVAEIEMTILPDGLPPYPVTTHQMISQFQIPQFQPGASLVVKVDPNDPSSVFIDTMASSMKPPGAA